MKIQYLAVIFVVIMIPITLVLSSYIQAQIDTINLQTSYSSKLYDATYDAVTAFQINTVNNKYSSVSNSKIRDIEASANTFFTSLADNMNATGYTKDALQPYVPALVYTLYDGFYIYGKYKNVMPEEGKVQSDEDSEYQWGLKPYVYYSCRYRNSSTEEVVINYTLDNFITVYYKNGNDYITKSGYLINPSAWNGSTYNGIEITDGKLTEKLLFKEKADTNGDGAIDDNDTYDTGTYEYVIYQNQKIYIDPNGGTNGTYFRYDDYQKSYFSPNTQTAKDIEDYINAMQYNNGSYQNGDAHKYFNEAKEFSEWVNNNLGWVTQAKAVDSEGNSIQASDWEDLNVSTKDANESIFDTQSASNNPFSTDSLFDENRRAVIKYTIQTTLVAAIGAYNEYSGVNYEFALPKMEESDWAKIQNHICVFSFMQGLPIGGKYYNNYAILTNDKNEEFVAKNAIYITTQTESSNIEYHQPGCSRLIENNDTTNMTVIARGNFKEAYFNIDFLRQTVRIAENNYIYFYPQAKKYRYRCYKYLYRLL